MKVLVSWLNEFLPTKVDAKTAAARLEQAGIEIEQIISSTEIDKKVIIARVKKVVQHPSADRLKLVDVDTGNEVVRVVCGAPNVVEGLVVALAQPGAVLPDGTEIKVATIRGEDSAGMLCSARELGLGDDHSGILTFDSDISLGTTLCDIVSLSEILDLTTAANRPDLLSVQGLAREVAAQGGEVAQELKVGDREVRVDSDLVDEVDKKTVKRYVLARVKLGVNGESPDWMQQRLRAAGLRPINSVVDITNYVMLEVGQPLHAFDAENISLPIGVHSPRSVEKLATLDGVTRELHRTDLVIYDSKGPIALAGVMGGLSSQIIAESNEILVEAACFDGAVVRRMAIRNGMRTDASSRFEKNLPLPLVDLGMKRALDLLENLCDAKVISISSSIENNGVFSKLNASLPRISALLGLNVSRSIADAALTNLGYKVSGADDKLELLVPWWRPDVILEEDIVEEVGRAVGYDKLPATLPSWSPKEVDFDQYWPRLWQLKALMRGLSFDEIVTYSFVSRTQLDDFDDNVADHLRLKNPLSTEQAYLRSNLAPSLIATVARNAHSFSSFGMFEVSKVYLSKGDHTQLPHEPVRLGVVWRGQDGYIKVKNVLDTLSREFAQFRVVPKSIRTLLPSRSAQVELEERTIGWIGEIHTEILKRHKVTGKVGYLEIDLQPWLSYPKVKQFHEISRFPVITRDLSIVMTKDTLWLDIEAVVQTSKTTAVEYLSEYYGNDLPAGKKSVAIRLTFSSLDRTLTDKEADAGADKIMRLLAEKFDAKLRS